jgi:hypothetical protein
LTKKQQEIFILEASTNVMEERELRRVVFASMLALLKCLKSCLRPMAKKSVMEKILSHFLL